MPSCQLSSTCGPYISYLRCGAMPSFRAWSTTVLPSACAISACSTSRLCTSYERYGTMPSFRRRSPPAMQRLRVRRRHAFRASCHRLPCCRRGAAAPADLTSLACDAEPCRRAGGGFSDSAAVSAGKRGPRHQHALHLSRVRTSYERYSTMPSRRRRSPPAMQLLRVRQRHAAFGPVVIAYRAAVGARAKGQRRLLASHLLRAMLSHASGPEEVFLQCCRQRGQKGGPAAPAGLTPLSELAGRRPGWPLHQRGIAQHGYLCPDR